jgi:YYY domain-containing protein
MLATIFALTLTMSFSIGVQLQRALRLQIDQKTPNSKHQNSNKSQYLNSKHFNFLNLEFVWNLRFVICDLTAGLLTSFLVTFAGNMQTIYAFTKGYVGENVQPFWGLLWTPPEFISKVGEGMARYWYANATRFIPFTIHEFPSYSFVVSDVHGHVLSIPFVLLAIALLIVFVERLFYQERSMSYDVRSTNKKQTGIFSYFIPHTSYIVFYGFLLGILLMTNALDGPVYFGLLGAILVITNIQFPLLRQGFGGQAISNIKWIKKIVLPLGIVGIVIILTTLPFLVHFQSFATGIGVNCPPAFLANTKIGPFIFEGVEKCQKSPLWMMWLLWGFFWYCGAFLFIRRVWEKGERSPIHKFLSILFLYGVFLIIIPEFFYAKDIYPAHFRSNTMFKLGYQAFIMWSITAAFVIVHFLFMRRHPPAGEAGRTEDRGQIWFFRFPTSVIRPLFFIVLIPQLFLVSIFPIFSVRSYFGELKTYHGIYGLEWLEKEYPDDYAAISWLKYQSASWRINLNDQKSQLPVIVEADGDSYTDYNHVSAFTGVPTIVGWAVHEWLWRGSYDVVAPKREEVRTVYESEDIEAVRVILARYRVRYVLVGRLEREKFKNLKEGKFWAFGPPVLRTGATVVWEVKSGQ